MNLAMTGLIMSLAGCAGFVRQASVDSVTIRKHEIDNVNHVCNEKVGIADIYIACAVKPNWAANTCDIYVSPGASAEVIAHESARCFGFSHPNVPVSGIKK
jgi:hypothetical protein